MQILYSIVQEIIADHQIFMLRHILKLTNGLLDITTEQVRMLHCIMDGIVVCTGDLK